MNQINHKWCKKLVEIRIAKTSKFVVKLWITPEHPLSNPLINGTFVVVSISTFGVVVSVVVSNVVVISDVVVVIVVV